LELRNPLKIKTVAKQEYNQIRDAVSSMLKASTVVRRKNKSKVEKKRELFAKTMNSLEEVLTRSHLLYSDASVDFSSYDEKFMSIIDSLILMHFGTRCFDLISWYLYDRITHDGTQSSTINDENGNEIHIQSAYDLYDLIVRVNPNV